MCRSSAPLFRYFPPTHILFSTVFNLVIPLSLCLIPFFSQYHLNDSCKPLRIFSCEWWGFLLKGEKKEIHSVGTFTSFPILSFLSFSHILSLTRFSITLQFNYHNKYERGFFRDCEGPGQWILCKIWMELEQL